MVKQVKPAKEWDVLNRETKELIGRVTADGPANAGRAAEKDLGVNRYAIILKPVRN